MTDEDRLLAALERDGSDALLKQALADLFEEGGREAHAACMRWAATEGRWPTTQTAGGGGM